MGLDIKDAMVKTYCPTKVVALSIKKFTESTGNFKITFDTPQCDQQNNDCTDRYLVIPVLMVSGRVQVQVRVKVSKK